MEKPKIIKSRFFEPYTGKKSNLNFCKNKAGIYIIKEEGKICYIGFSATNLEKTCLRHFQSWEDTKQVRTTYNRKYCTVRIILTTPARAEALERALIVKIQPKDNPEKYNRYTLTKRDREIIEELDDLTPKPWKVCAATWEDAPF